MNYRHVCVESLGYCLPDEVVTSSELEARLAPVYERLRLPEGRLEALTGIVSRRFWPAGTLPSQYSTQSAERALKAAQFERRRVGALVHGSVCRDYLEPATAAGVHHALGLPAECQVYDVSNACLGLLSAMLQIANMIELGQIEAGIAVGTEGSRQLVETTIRTLNEDRSLTRQSIKSAVASLTIGSGSCAILLTHADVSRTQNRLLGGVVRADTMHHALCRSGQDEAVGSGMQPLMHTDSERLMQEGVATGQRTFERFLSELGWSREDLDQTICHQVGLAHRRLLLETLGLPAERDFTTLEWMGNTGSVALPLTLAVAAQRQIFEPGANVALLGIGSGINCVMLGVEMQQALVEGDAVDEPSVLMSR